MKLLRRFLDRLSPMFAKGGKLEKLQPLYEATDTFLYSPGTVTGRAAHVRDAMDLKRMMTIVVVALLPCTLMAMWNTGYQANLAMQGWDAPSAGGWRGAVMEALRLGYSPGNMLACLVHGALYFIPVYVVTVVAGGFWEVLFACVRKHEVNEGFFVTSLLFPLTLPPMIPLWQVALGISFGVVLGKEVFGGTGKNFLNPALTARAFLYFAYPSHISGNVWTAVKADGLSGATALGELSVAGVDKGMDAVTAVGSWWQYFLGVVPGSMGETSTLACLLGAAFLIATGVGSWRIMAAIVAGAGVLSCLLWGFVESTSNAMLLMPPWWHLVVGGFAFGTVFMATDPVSASMTETGKWIYGALIGVMTILIRVFNPGYPEGIMLAILFGNVFAPLIDYYVVQANIKKRLARNAA